MKAKSFFDRLYAEKTEVGKAMDLVKLCKFATGWLIDTECQLMETPLEMAHELLLNAHIQLAVLAEDMKSNALQDGKARNKRQARIARRK